jgi:predicted metal-dependent hydrolase
MAKRLTQRSALTSNLQLDDLTIEVVRKNIKHIHLTVRPPDGQVRISAPTRMGMETIRAFATAKLGWIRRHQARFQAQEREAPREFVDRESHYVWGRRYLLRVAEEEAAPPSVELEHGRLVLRVRPGSDRATRRAVLEAWYRSELKTAIPPLIAKWELLMGVKVARFFVQRMKTRWGSCNPRQRNIRLNTELARKPQECLEYVVVHEMVHLLEPSHSARFYALMDQFMPQWRAYKAELNRLPISHAGSEA